MLREVFKRCSPQLKGEGPWRSSLRMGLGEFRGSGDLHMADASPLLHSVSQADPEQAPFQQVPSTW